MQIIQIAPTSFSFGWTGIGSPFLSALMIVHVLVLHSSPNLPIFWKSIGSKGKKDNTHVEIGSILQAYVKLFSFNFRGWYTPMHLKFWKWNLMISVVFVFLKMVFIVRKHTLGLKSQGDSKHHKTKVHTLETETFGIQKLKTAKHLDRQKACDFKIRK